MTDLRVTAEPDVLAANDLDTPVVGPPEAIARLKDAFEGGDFPGSIEDFASELGIRHPTTALGGASSTCGVRTAKIWACTGTTPSTTQTPRSISDTGYAAS